MVRVVEVVRVVLVDVTAVHGCIKVVAAVGECAKVM